MVHPTVEIATPESVAAGSTAADDAPLEPMLVAVEQGLDALGVALRDADSLGIARHADALHGALAAAVEGYRCAARSARVPAALRHRLALAGAKVAAQREALARATAALDRAIDTLMPQSGGALYSPLGNAQRGARGDSISA